MVLGNSGGELMTRLGNKIYEACRSKAIDLASFPDFAPTIKALREGPVSQSTATYKVCVQHHSQLQILQSMAEKWVQTDALREKAMSIIENHNKRFNVGGEMWFEERRRAHHPLSH
jgi:hypothetical protein